MNNDYLEVVINRNAILLYNRYTHLKKKKRYYDTKINYA